MSAFTKPFAAMWRARAYVIAGVIVYLLSFIPLPYKSATPDSLEWWQVIIAKSFGSLDKIAYALLLAGLVYALLSDLFDFIWSSKLGEEFNKAVDKTGGIIQGGLDKFVSGLGTMSFEAVKVWIENGQTESKELRTVGASSLKSHFGKHHDGAENFVDFVLDSIVDASARADTQTWDRFISNITIRKGTLPEHFQWEEQRTYTIVCHLMGCSIPMRIENSWRVGPDHIQAALAHLEYTLELDGDLHIHLKKWCEAQGAKLKSPTFNVTADGITLSYDGIWLAFKLAKDFKIQGANTRVSIFERSHISDQDRCYTLAFRHPTKGLRLTLTLEGLPDWVVKQPIASAVAYNRGANIVDIRQPHYAAASVDMAGWTLPGLAVVTEWTPK